MPVCCHLPAAECRQANRRSWTRPLRPPRSPPPFSPTNNNNSSSNKCSQRATIGPTPSICQLSPNSPLRSNNNSSSSSSNHNNNKVSIHSWPASRQTANSSSITTDSFTHRRVRRRPLPRRRPRHPRRPSARLTHRPTRPLLLRQLQRPQQQQQPQRLQPCSRQPATRSVSSCPIQRSACNSSNNNRVYQTTITTCPSTSSIWRPRCSSAAAAAAAALRTVSCQTLATNFSFSISISIISRRPRPAPRRLSPFRPTTTTTTAAAAAAATRTRAHSTTISFCNTSPPICPRVIIIISSSRRPATTSPNNKRCDRQRPTPTDRATPTR